MSIRTTMPWILLLFGSVGAWMQPRWGFEADAATRRGVDLLVCLDVSRSMLARDVGPDRLQRAKAEVEALMTELGEDRIGLVLVAGEARRAAPLTRDFASYRAILQLADPQSLRQGGTDLAAALETAATLLEDAADGGRHVLLLTDGEDRAGRAAEFAAAIGAQGIQVHTLGVGTARGGKITLTDRDGQEFFLQDAFGKEVVTRLMPASLDRIAAATRGSSLQLQEEVGVLVPWYREVLLPQLQEAAIADPDMERANRFQWPLGVAGIGAFLLLSGLTRRRR
ncbi:MAG: VWA domain-containing protein [Planctomycetota bacterium]